MMSVHVESVHIPIEPKNSQQHYPYGSSFAYMVVQLLKDAMSYPRLFTLTKVARLPNRLATDSVIDIVSLSV